jgi:stage II sporulation protein R
MKMKGLVIFTSLVLLTAILSGAAPVNGEVGLYDKIIRLHVIANSDSEEDQALKLKVSEAALECMDGFISADATLEQSKQILQANETALTDACKAVIEEAGKEYEITVVYGVETYPEKCYDGITLPAGDYYSVRIVIGEGAGQNWWCVLFPPLCIGAAKDRGQKLVSAGLTKDEIDIISDSESEKYVIKFKILEFLRETFKRK